MRKWFCLGILIALLAPVAAEAQRNTPTYIQMKTATIASSGSLSSSVALGSNTIVGIYIPSSWTTANLTFSCSTNDGNYSNVYDEYGLEYTVTAAASRFIFVEPKSLTGCSFIKVRSGTSGTPVTQAAARQLDIILRPW